MVHIPYRGIAPAFTELIGSQTQAMFPALDDSGFKGFDAQHC
jgi:tripartite-type tricarboxylate transporter receptor subunit TctC